MQDHLRRGIGSSGGEREHILALNVNQSGHPGKLPKVPLCGRGDLRTTITYQAPELTMDTLGYLPGDQVSAEIANADYTPYNGEKFGGRGSCQQFTYKPRLDGDGKPVMVTRTKEINVSLGTTLAGHATIGGVLGGILGGVVGGVVGLFLGVPLLGAAWGAGLAGGAFGVASAAEESCQRARLEWREKQIVDEKMVGLRKLETPIEKDGLTQRFEADVRSTHLGTYWEPVVVYYNAVTGKVEREG